jgi:hypothetical protein
LESSTQNPKPDLPCEALAKQGTRNLDLLAHETPGAAEPQLKTIERI